jgi:hypothetical protein
MHRPGMRRGRWDLGGRSQRPVAQLPPVPHVPLETTRTQTLGATSGVSPYHDDLSANTDKCVTERWSAVSDQDGSR